MQIDQSDIHRIRNKHTVELRKQNREEIFMKKRNIGNDKTTIEEQNSNDLSAYTILDQRYRSIIQSSINRNYQPQQLKILVAALNNFSPQIRHEAVIGVRKIISAFENEQIIQLVIDSGALPIIIALLGNKQFPHIRFEASWIISNIASGTTLQCQAIVEKNGLQALFQLLEDSNFRLNEQAIWAIGNIGGDSVKLRDSIIQKNGVSMILKLVDKSTHKSLLKRAAWAISNICRGTPLPKYEAIKNALSSLAKIIVSNILNDDELSDCLWAISNHTNEGQKTRIQRIVEINNFVGCLIHICKTHQKSSIYTPALRIIGNISIGNQLHTEEILKCGGLQLFQKLLENPKKILRRQACWIISNLCAGTPSQIRQVISRTSLAVKIAAMLWQDEIEIKREISYIFRNICKVGDKPIALEVIVSLNIVEGVLNLIRQDEDVQAIEAGIKCLFEMLQVGQRQHEENIILKQVQSIPGCLERLQSLQYHKSKQIYKGLTAIFKTFFKFQENDVLL